MDRREFLKLGAQGLLARVWPDCVHFEKRDFTSGKRLDPHWEVKL